MIGIKKCTYKDFTKETKEQIKKYYEEDKLSGLKIAKKLNTYHEYIYRVLKEYNVKMRSDSEQATIYKYNENYFDIIDSEYKAYWLGFIYADGYIVNKAKHNNYAFGITLSSKDKNHLKKFKKHINSNHPIKEYTYDGFKKVTGCRILMRGNHVCEQLIDKGVVVKKTLILEFPSEDVLPNDLKKHFIRGFIDGDGSIKYYYCKKGYFCSEVGLCGTKEMLKSLLIYFDKPNLKLHKRHKNNTNNYQVNIGGNKQVIKILDHLYKDANIYLDRKYEKYLEIKNIYNSKE